MTGSILGPLTKVLPGILPLVFLGLLGTRWLIPRRKNRRALRVIQNALVITPVLAGLAAVALFLRAMSGLETVDAAERQAFIAAQVAHVMNVTLGAYVVVAALLIATIAVAVFGARRERY
jgi:hypothetical protein